MGTSIDTCRKIVRLSKKATRRHSGGGPELEFTFESTGARISRFVEICGKSLRNGIEISTVIPPSVVMILVPSSISTWKSQVSQAYG